MILLPPPLPPGSLVLLPSAVKYNKSFIHQTEKHVRLTQATTLGLNSFKVVTKSVNFFFILIYIFVSRSCSFHYACLNTRYVYFFLPPEKAFYGALTSQNIVWQNEKLWSHNFPQIERKRKICRKLIVTFFVFWNTYLDLGKLSSTNK